MNNNSVHFYVTLAGLIVTGLAIAGLQELLIRFFPADK